MALTDTGKIAGDYWFNIPEHFPHAVLHEFIVMPNHIHGIIEIVGTSHGMSIELDNEISNEISDAAIVRPCHEMDDERSRHGVSLPDNRIDPVRPSHGMANTTQFGKPVPGSISVIINQYKSSVKRWCNKNGHSLFQWQSRFHDHIIRDEQSYQRISEYIINNPAKWADDKFYSA